MTTEVSSRPRVGSAIEGWIDYSVEVGPEARGINVGRTRSRFRDHRAWHETFQLDWTQFGHRIAVARYYERLTRLHVPQHRCGIIAQFPLTNDSVHGF